MVSMLSPLGVQTNRPQYDLLYDDNKRRHPCQYHSYGIQQLTVPVTFRTGPGAPRVKRRFAFCCWRACFFFVGGLGVPPVSFRFSLGDDDDNNGVEGASLNCLYLFTPLFFWPPTTQPMMRRMGMNDDWRGWWGRLRAGGASDVGHSLEAGALASQLASHVSESSVRCGC